MNIAPPCGDGKRLPAESALKVFVRSHVAKKTTKAFDVDLCDSSIERTEPDMTTNKCVWLIALREAGTLIIHYLTLPNFPL